MKKTGVFSAFGPSCILAGVVVLYSAYLVFAFAQQPPLDLHSFRQTQTALTAYWFVQEGFKLAYETPVVGAPWAIPFEFPIYQLIVAYISKFSGLSLDFTGRVTSYVFLLLCLIPVRSLIKRIEIPDHSFVFFIVILFSMPVYVYWGRSFMIETTALFFAVASIKYFLDFWLHKRSFVSIVLFCFFSTLALLQKSTTELPILGLLSIVFLISELRRTGSVRAAILSRTMIRTGIYVLIPVVIGFAWVVYSDQVKLLNPLGGYLTSAALSKWNWGTLPQRIAPDLWVKVVWRRIFVSNGASVLGLFILAVPFLVSVEFRIRAILVSAIAFCIVPLLMFPNLHFIHDYYQTSSVIFLAFAMAVSLTVVFIPLLGRPAGTLLLVLIVFSNFVALRSAYLPEIKRNFGMENRDLAVGEVLKRELPSDMQFVAFGNNWSSTFAYMSQRKSFTVPEWFSKYDQVSFNPESFVEQGRLGGVVACSVESPEISRLLNWASEGRSWKVGETHGCLIATPQKPLKTRNFEPAQCEGNIDKAEMEDRKGHNVISITGWTAMPGFVASDNVFLVLSGQNGGPIYLEALKVPRPDVNLHLGISNRIDMGFSRLISSDLAPGEYDIGVVRYAAGQYQACQFNKKIAVK